MKIEIGCETGRRKYRKVKKSSREDRKIEDEAFFRRQKRCLTVHGRKQKKS